MISEQEMMKGLLSDELAEKIVKASSEYSGFIDNFYEAVGMVVVGQLFGSRVMRLVSSRRCWSEANKIFGDLNDERLMPKIGPFAHRSWGYQIVEKSKDYWEYIKGSKVMPLAQRKTMNPL